MTQVLSSDAILAFCSNEARQVAIRIVEETGSTNADLLAQLNADSVPTLLIALRQTHGRGRAGRTWHSAGGEGLTFSLAWKFDRPLAGLLGLPLAIGVALAKALTKFSVQVQLKWPNDVLKNGKKLAGILTETATLRGVSAGVNTGVNQDGNGNSTWAVIGIGLNLTVPDGMEAQIGHEVADAPWLAQLDRNILMAGMLNALTETLVEFERAGFAAFVEPWNRLHAYAGKQIQIIDHGQIIHEGIARGVDASGYLSIDTVSGRVAVLAGDVSLRATGGQ